MNCIKTKIGVSSIHGIGLFADQDIPQGTVIWKYNPLVDISLTQDQIDSLDPNCKNDILNFSWKTRDGIYILNCDNNRFMNYSKDNNVEDNDDIESPSIAKRFIKKGEELTSNYCFDHSYRNM